jgi:ADP-ribosylglycohydrolase
MKHPNDLMLLYLAQGDAFGMATEYLELPKDQAAKDEALKFERYVKHPVWDIPAGRYTDDTQMSIAVAETLLANDFTYSKAPRVTNADSRMAWQDDWEKIVAMRRAFADSFVRCFRRDPRLGYSKYFQAFLETVTNGDDLLIRCNPNSDKNGAAMRSVPIGVLPYPRQVLHVAGEQANITHATEGGRTSAMMIALMSHFALYHDEPFSRMREFLAQHLRIHWNDEPGLAYWDGEPVAGIDVGAKTARAVMTLLVSEKTLVGMAKRAIVWGGDTDTVIALAWGIGSTRLHGEVLPAFLDTDLEKGSTSYGAEFLVELGAKLMKKYQ